jgi:hypothetical protein
MRKFVGVIGVLLLVGVGVLILMFFDSITSDDNSISLIPLGYIGLLIVAYKLIKDIISE